MGRARRPIRTPTLFGVALVALLWCPLEAGAAARGPVGLANPMVGTGAGAPNHGTGGAAGSTFPGATRPFGMVQWSPDTHVSRTNLPGGYTHSDKRIRGFSLKHLSGAGCPIYQDVSFLPITWRPRSSPAQPVDSDLDVRYLPRFSHRGERARPGYYRVRLNRGSRREVGVQLTATTRTGLGRFRFPRRSRPTLLINAGASAAGNQRASVEIRPRRREVSGTVASGGFCDGRNTYRLSFVVRFDRRFGASGTWKRQRLRPGARSSRDAEPLGRVQTESRRIGRRGPTAQSGAYVSFNARRERAVTARVGISFVSVKQARRNLRAERMKGKRLGFAAARRASRAHWKRALGRISLAGGARADRSRFYTALYHSLLHPSTFSDANGRYRGMDGRVHRARGYTKYADFSGWDVYRTQIPLLAMLFPDRASEMVRSLLADWRQTGRLPRWPVANGESGTMVGDPADPIIASAYALGARDFDAVNALQAMVRGATQPGRGSGYVQRPGLQDYLDRGYLPWTGENREPGPAGVWGPSATTLEYALADFTIAQLASRVCAPSVYSSFMRRSANWRNVFDRGVRRPRPRRTSGEFVATAGASENGFVEGSSAQYTWTVPQDVGGLSSALGGPAALAERLDRFFARLNAGPESVHAFLGNEPSLGAPWMYAWAGRPYRTQAVTRRALLSLYDGSPGGFPGNDDLGTLSAWYVFAALGLYPAIPGTDVLVFGSPLFPEVTLRLPGGAVRIAAAGAERDSPYVRSLTLDGQPYERTWLPFSALADGGRLQFEVGPEPDPEWASAPEAAPPSYRPLSPIDCGSG